jgi:hypothetical protein
MTWIFLCPKCLICCQHQNCACLLPKHQFSFFMLFECSIFVSICPYIDIEIWFCVISFDDSALVNRIFLREIILFKDERPTTMLIMMIWSVFLFWSNFALSSVRHIMDPFKSKSLALPWHSLDQHSWSYTDFAQMSMNVICICLIYSSYLSR